MKNMVYPEHGEVDVASCNRWKILVKTLKTN